MTRVCVARTDIEPAGDDWQDIQAARRGDGEAFGRIVQRHQADLAARMWRFTRDPAELELLVQNVLIEAYRSLARYRGKGSFQGWLRRIATRVGYRFWKDRAAQRQNHVALGDWDGPAVEPESSDPAAAAELVHHWLSRLPPRDRLVLTLLYLEECSVAEVADRTGWSRAMVKVQAHRARRKLARLLRWADCSNSGEVARGSTGAI